MQRGHAVVAVGGEHRDDVRFVDRADVRHAVGENRGDGVDVAQKAVARIGAQPTAGPAEPRGQREVLQRDERPKPTLQCTVDHAAVVVHCGAGDVAVGGFDA